MRYWNKLLLILIVILTVFGFAGCKPKENKIKKLKDLEFTVVEEADIPGELKEVINEKKEKPFKMHYSNKDWLYIVVGYGKQNSGGYSIAVEDLYLTENAIYIDTNLIGPSQNDLVTQGITYPYIVVKLPFTEMKKIVFE